MCTAAPSIAQDAPSVMARYTCVSVLVGIFALWGKFSFVDEASMQVGDDIHSYKVPLALTVFYVISLPMIRRFTSMFKQEYMKQLLNETMIFYNGAQVVLNAWMLYRFLHALFVRGHPFVGDIDTVNKGATYAVWIHYCDKYLEFLDTYFMELRGKTDQVSFLHVYHHFTIAWAWWIGLYCWPGGDAYFGALLNSAIHVMMYSYYTLSLLKISCPWKRYLTMGQLTQFSAVMVYSLFSYLGLPKHSDWRHTTALSCQFLEMVSLFALFFLFYKSKYSGKGKKSEKNGKVADYVAKKPEMKAEKVLDDTQSLATASSASSDSS